MSDMIYVSLLGDGPGERIPLRVHGRGCRPPCPVHAPSDHPQAAWPHGWDPAERVMTRLCPHDVHHPDPDDQNVRLHPDLAQHDGDGCCAGCRRTIDGEWLDGEYEDDRPDEQIQLDLHRARKAIAARREEGP